MHPVTVVARVLDNAVFLLPSHVVDLRHSRGCHVVLKVFAALDRTCLVAYLNGFVLPVVVVAAVLSLAVVATAVCETVWDPPQRRVCGPPVLIHAILKISFLLVFLRGLDSYRLIARSVLHTLTSVLSTTTHVTFKLMKGTIALFV
jgi:hypothetical protein